MPENKVMTDKPKHWEIVEGHIFCYADEYSPQGAIMRLNELEQREWDREIMCPVVRGKEELIILVSAFGGYNARYNANEYYQYGKTIREATTKLNALLPSELRKK